MLVGVSGNRFGVFGGGNQRVVVGMGGSIAAAVVVVAILWSFVWLVRAIESDSCPPNAEDDSSALPSCIFQTTVDKKMYRFDLAAQIQGFPHGIRSEDGFYKVSIEACEKQAAATYWFQLCEHMKFNHDPPICLGCETCGGLNHCGETCSALQSVSYPGYSVCTTLGYPKTTSFSLIDPQKPEQGVRVKMLTCNGPNGNCSLVVSVYCNRNGIEVPTNVQNVSWCDFETSMTHPVGCPIVTTIGRGSWGWFGTIFIMFICGFFLYMAIGITYRITVLRVSGFEAIPHLDFWQGLPLRIKNFFEYIYGQCMELYQQHTQESYMRVNG
ncbi:unnamed protein product [Sphagnum balticum]